MVWLKSRFASSNVALTDRDWIATIPSWPDTFRYRQMKDVALELSKELRDPKGEHRVDIIIAITHSRVPNVGAVGEHADH